MIKSVTLTLDKSIPDDVCKDLVTRIKTGGDYVGGQVTLEKKRDVRVTYDEAVEPDEIPSLVEELVEALESAWEETFGD